MTETPKPKINPETVALLLSTPGWNHCRIVKEFAISSKTVTAISKGTYEAQKKGRKPKYQENHIAYIIECTFLDPRASALAISQKFMIKFPTLKICEQSVRNVIKEHGYKYLSARKIQNLNEVQIAIRYNFALSLLNSFDADAEFWKLLVFSDESRFCAASDSRVMVWRKVDDFRDAVCTSHVKFPVSCMVWGAIGVGFKSDLTFIEGTLNANDYIELLKTNGIFQKCNDIIGSSFIFQQDGAPCHTASVTLDWLRIQAKVKLLFGWPPESPDLSPIEIIWGAIKCKISHYKTFPQTKKELCDAVKAEWDAFDQSNIGSLVLSFRERLVMCKKVGGKSISHFISAHLTEIPSEYLVKDDECPPIFTKEEDAVLMQMFNEGNQKRRWSYIAKKLGQNYTPRIVKYRILLLSAINKINEGLDPEIENENSLELDDDEEEEEEEKPLEKVISFEEFLQKYYVNKKQKETYLFSVTTPINEANDEQHNTEAHEVRRRITIRYENEEEGNSLPRRIDSDNPFISDEMSITTDESE